MNVSLRTVYIYYGINITIATIIIVCAMILLTAITEIAAKKSTPAIHTALPICFPRKYNCRIPFTTTTTTLTMQNIIVQSVAPKLHATLASIMYHR